MRTNTLMLSLLALIFSTSVARAELDLSAEIAKAAENIKATDADEYTDKLMAKLRTVDDIRVTRSTVRVGGGSTKALDLNPVSFGGAGSELNLSRSAPNHRKTAYSSLWQNSVLYDVCIDSLEKKAKEAREQYEKSLSEAPAAYTRWSEEHYLKLWDKAFSVTENTDAAQRYVKDNDSKETEKELLAMPLHVRGKMLDLQKKQNALAQAMSDAEKSRRCVEIDSYRKEESSFVKYGNVKRVKLKRDIKQGVDYGDYSVVLFKGDRKDTKSMLEKDLDAEDRVKSGSAQ